MMMMMMMIPITVRVCVENVLFFFREFMMALCKPCSVLYSVGKWKV